MSPRSLLRSFAAISLCLANCFPAEAIPGRLPGYSARHVRHVTTQNRRSSGKRVASRTTSKRVKSASTRKQGGKYSRQLSRTASRGKSARLVKTVRGTASSANGRNFIWEATGPSNGISASNQDMVRQAFNNGRAHHYSPAMLTNANVFTHAPMRGGIYKRRESVKYIVLHSTETARVADAQRVIKSWSNRGLRHPGAQFVVDRDGTIYNTVEPTAYATVHVDTRKAKKGINNDNSIGIEIVHTGSQVYTDEQIAAVAGLVTYLQNRFAVDKNNILTHSFVQPSDRSDPVNFNWGKFTLERSNLQNSETAYTLPTETQYSAAEATLATTPETTFETTPETTMESPTEALD